MQLICEVESEFAYLVAPLGHQVHAPVQLAGFDFRAIAEVLANQCVHLFVETHRARPVCPPLCRPLKLLELSLALRD
eukprot:8864044-Pyramimonas_sp.AAC.1